MEYRIYHIALPNDDAAAIEKMLSDAGVLVSAHARRSDLYSMLTYIEAKHEYQQQVYMLLDRNLVTRLADLAASRDISRYSRQDHWRLAAAVLSFCITSSIAIEPSISMYELASGCGQHASLDELYHLRVIDNIDPRVAADVALGRCSRIKRKEVGRAAARGNSADLPDDDFEKDLTDFRILNNCVMKAQTIRSMQMAPCRKFRAFVEWERDEALFNSVATMFAMMLFGNRKSISLIKHQLSADIDKVRHGLENATWDLVHANFFRKKSVTSPKSEAWLFASQDVQLREIASSWFVEGGTAAFRGKMKGIVEQYYTKDQTNEVFNVLSAAEASFNLHDRAAHRQNYADKIEAIREKLLEELGIGF
jgi:hypothetical protein